MGGLRDKPLDRPPAYNHRNVMSESSVCDKKEWCVLQKGHKGPNGLPSACSPIFETKGKEKKPEIPYVIDETL